MQAWRSGEPSQFNLAGRFGGGGCRENRGGGTQADRWLADLYGCDSVTGLCGLASLAVSSLLPAIPSLPFVPCFVSFFSCSAISVINRVPKSIAAIGT